ncbi:MAG: SWIM zinc finger family protein, partial [Chloroflexota bacterium]|nr:SWIM zinc finger family protein [Chloroflexota bacterium]
ATAGVRDPAGGAYTPQLAVRPLRQDEWVAAATALLGDPVLAAALDAGLLPPGAAPVLTVAGVALLPIAADLAADCACGERVPCRHVAALVYAVAAALESDPWLLPLLRGRDRAGFTQALAVARADLTPQPPSLRRKGESGFLLSSTEELWEQSSSAPPPLGEGRGERSSSAPPLKGEGRGEQSSSAPPFVGEGLGERSVATPQFWHPGSALATLSIPITAPPQPAPALRQLGPPPFWTPPTAFLPHLEPVYAAVTAAVLRLLADETVPDTAESA